MMQQAITFDDVILTPQYSEISSRNLIDVSVSLDHLDFKHPIIPANMKTITGFDMAESVYFSGGLAIFHRFMEFNQLLDIFKQIEEIDRVIALNGEIVKHSFLNHAGFSVGVKPNDYELVNFYGDRGIKILCIDIAHGDSKHCVEMINFIKKNHPTILIIAGNVSTGSGANRLWEAGADVVKVGQGNGRTCSTRIETGNGVPQLTALMDVWQYVKKERYVISDGGLKSSGDIVKALVYSHMVMTGNLFAGCPETPTDTIYIDGKPFKAYVGSSTHKLAHIEGIETAVPLKQSFHRVLERLLQGVRSGCSYQGAENLAQLKKKAVFMQMSSASLLESYPRKNDI